MASKKDYLAIAKIIRDNITHSEPVPWIDLDNFVKELSDYFEEDNPNFDRDKFYKACHGRE